MDRQIVYPAQIPLDSDLLNAQRNAFVGLGHLAGMAYGDSTVSAGGFACTPGTGLTVTIAPGSLLAAGVVDGTAYGTLAANGSLLVRQHVSRDPVTLDVPGAGATYTVYATPATVDADAAVLPFYNAANPSVTYAGADNSGKAAPTVRQDVAQLGIGTSVPDGAYPLWTVTVPAGATAITADMIAQADGAPFYYTIPQLQASITDLQTETDGKVSTAENDNDPVNGRVATIYYDKERQLPVAYGPSMDATGLPMLVSQPFGNSGYSFISNMVYRQSDGALQVNVGTISDNVLADFAPVSSVTEVQNNLTASEANQADINASVSSELGVKISTNASNDGSSAPVTFIAHNDSTNTPYVYGPDFGTHSIIPSIPGDGFRQVINITTDSKGNILIVDTSGNTMTVTPSYIAKT